MLTRSGRSPDRPALHFSSPFRNGQDYDDVDEYDGEDGDETADAPLQVNTDDASDYYPSDAEDENPNGPKKRLTRGNLDIFSSRAAPTVLEMQNRFGNQVAYAFANMRRYNTTERRWVDKGPIIIFIILAFPARITANYLYGTKSLALNLRVFPFLDYILRVNRLRVWFSTFGANSVNTATVEEFRTKVSEYYSTEVGDNRQITIVKTDIVPTQEDRGAPVCFKFVDRKSLEFFVNALITVCNIERQHLEQQRVQSFLDPRRVMSCHSKQESTSQRVEMNCPYRSHPDFVGKLVSNGWMYFPVEDDIRGSFYTNTGTMCQFCKVFCSDWTERSDVAQKHRELCLAEGKLCPFGVPEHDYWHNGTPSAIERPGRAFSYQ
ncbi:hypothetical protein SmJEL517_g00481 [Synchytrium microbalum]|uniref:Uncharacterized protein n=1 Tax=Synchytrium microbalum TaxID=1806994 RepID=A0A507CEW4_9FUNG|nr:uncharacterized protein SmJEL517_g00481 [Synchytrium microbalum]TPX37729.1 hypothetical protein SmJEL517_g00481 [Synchytrium microbalum]